LSLSIFVSDCLFGSVSSYLFRLSLSSCLLLSFLSLRVSYYLFFLLSLCVSIFSSVSLCLSVFVSLCLCLSLSFVYLFCLSFLSLFLSLAVSLAISRWAFNRERVGRAAAGGIGGAAAATPTFLSMKLPVIIRATFPNLLLRRRVPPVATSRVATTKMSN